ATQDGRMSAFVFDQETPRDADLCAMRVALTTVIVRTRLVLFPGPGTPAWRPLDDVLGCPTPPPAEPTGEIIGEAPAP
ncbi:MAG: hypothetical protein M3R64_01300, partial [Pseudomonadota bacterium]|nr:hypothetical protein [Pseudomonadota bacterium]